VGGMGFPTTARMTKIRPFSVPNMDKLSPEETVWT
jgi:hypothetical protein